VQATSSARRSSRKTSAAPTPGSASIAAPAATTFPRTLPTLAPWREDRWCGSPGRSLKLEADLGNLDASREYVHAAIAEVGAVVGEDFTAFKPTALGRLAFLEGDWVRAVNLFREGSEEARACGHDGTEISALAWLAEAHLAAGRKDEALNASTRATRLHEALGYEHMWGFDSVELWWIRTQVLQACGQRSAARKSLARAYRFVVMRIATLGDEGLRRNA